MQEIAQNYQVQNGDVIQFDYKIVAIYEQSQIESIISKINEDPRMSVLGYNVEPSSWFNDLLHIQVKVNQNPFPVLLLVMAIAAVATSLFIYLTLDKIYLISREVPAAVTGGLSTMNLAIVAIIAGIALYGLKIFKG